MSRKAKPQPKPGPRRLYHHKTDGGAEYLCSSPVPGTDEGSFDSDIIIRLDGKPEIVRNNAAPKLAAVLREFIADIEAVGVKALTDENGPNYWPDLVLTYQHAKAAMKKAGLL